MVSIRHSLSSSLHVSVDAAFVVYPSSYFPCLSITCPSSVGSPIGAPASRSRWEAFGVGGVCAQRASLGGRRFPSSSIRSPYVPAYHPCALLQPLLVPADGALQSVAAPLNHTPNPDLRGTVGQPLLLLAAGSLARTHHACAVARANRQWTSPADARCSASTNMTDRLHSSMAHRAAEAYERA